jgi:hypothetical protein
VSETRRDLHEEDALNQELDLTEETYVGSTERRLKGTAEKVSRFK